MIQKSMLVALLLSATTLSAVTNEALQTQIETLTKELAAFKSEQTQTNEALLEEVANGSSGVVDTGDTYESFSSMGVAASKVYHSKDFLSIGGYGEYKYKKYFDYKNYATDSANETRNKSETNVVRFVPYIGFKFNDWIVMNTEIEFEDGGSKSVDDGKNYKYAIVEFSYLDFLFEKEYALRIGHILVPFGLVNLNHEPVAFLTSDRPAVETFIIPSTWHTNGALVHGKIDAFEYYAGIITSPDAGRFIEGRYIQQGRLGARQFSDDVSFVGRGTYDFSGINIGASFMYGESSVLHENRPGNTTGIEGHTQDVAVTMSMAEVHASYKNHGFDIQALATMGLLGGDTELLPGSVDDARVSDATNGAYLTVGYDLLHVSNTSQNLYLVAEVETLDMDVNNQTLYSDNYKFQEYTGGVAYFPDPKVVAKVDYKVRDYASGAKLADESSLTASIGFIF